MDRELLTAITALVVAAGSIASGAYANRKIKSEARSVAAETDRIEDERRRSAQQEARQAERRAARWSDAFYRLWRWLQAHWLEHHHSDNLELPARETFAGPDDDTDPGT